MPIRRPARRRAPQASQASRASRPEAAQAPTYEGRALPRPDEDLYDQGLGFDVTTLLGRRQVLAAMGLGVGATALAACGSPDSGTAASTSGSSSGSAGSASGTSSADAASADTEIPQETAGPYPGDGSNGPDVLEESGVVREDIRTSFGTGSATAEGVPMTLRLSLQDLDNGGAALAGAAVYVWHCDREGRYSMYSDGVENENYLRGVQISDDEGVVSFTSVVPGCYAGRWPHIHFEVYPDQASITDAGKAITVSQVALPEPMCTAAYATDGYDSSVGNLQQISLTSDTVFGDDGGARQLATVTGDVTKGYAVSLAVPVSAG
ncbi:intradiol ring-cleavage dioxygenase [Actinomycetota bacterium]